MAIFLLHRQKGGSTHQPPHFEEGRKNRVKKAVYSFWQQNPAFFYALFLCLGASFWFYSWTIPSLLFLTGIFTSCFFFYSSSQKYLAFFSAITALGFIYAFWLYPDVHRIPEKSMGQGVFMIDSLKPHTASFQKGYLYQGHFRSFITSDGQRLKNVPCNIFLRKKQYPADKNYQIAGNLLSHEKSHTCSFKPETSTNWIAQKCFWQLSEARFQYKKAIHHFLKSQLESVRSADFLTALVTGNLTNRTLKFEFGKLGQQHILAISGFHFGLLVWIFSFFLNRMFSRKLVTVLLLILVELYYIFLGNSPSIQRAWVMIQFALIAQLFSKRIFAINLLGCAACVEILFDPISITSLGFLLSFLACIAIFLLYQPMEKALRYFLPKRTPHVKKSASLTLRVIFSLSDYFRSALSLTLAINLLLTPILLFFFHRFALISVLYNLFFPLLVSLCMMLLVISLLLSFVPFLSTALFFMTNWVTDSVLQITANPPMILDYSIYLKNTEPSVLLFFLLAAIFWGIDYLYKEQQALTSHYPSHSLAR